MQIVASAPKPYLFGQDVEVWFKWQRNLKCKYIYNSNSIKSHITYSILCSTVLSNHSNGIVYKCKSKNKNIALSFNNREQEKDYSFWLITEFDAICTLP